MTKISPCVPATPHPLSPGCFALMNLQLTGEVVPPQRSDLILPTHIPDIELDVLVRDRFDVEAHGGNGGDGLVQLQLV